MVLNGDVFDGEVSCLDKLFYTLSVEALISTFATYSRKTWRISTKSHRAQLGQWTVLSKRQILVR